MNIKSKDFFFFSAVWDKNYNSQMGLGENGKKMSWNTSERLINLWGNNVFEAPYRTSSAAVWCFCFNFYQRA